MGKSYIRWTKSKKKELKTLLADGKTPEAIATAFNTTVGAIKGAILRFYSDKPATVKAPTGKLIAIYTKGGERMFQELKSLTVDATKEYLKALMTTEGVTNVVVAREAYSVTLNITEI